MTKSQREQGLDYREAEELSWCPSCSNSLWQGWSCGLVYCHGGNATDLIWRVLAYSDGISSWTPFKPQHSNPSPNPLANQLWSIDFLTPPSHLIIPHRHLPFLESLMSFKNWCSIHARCSKSSLKHSVRFCGIFPSLKQNFIAYRSSKVSSRPDCHFEIHQLWQSGFSRVYSNCCCSCLFEREIIKIGHKMYSNNILNFQESTTILNAWQKSLETYWRYHVYIKYIRFGLVLWLINHCWLFNAKFSLYIYINYIYFGLAGFYGISTIAKSSSYMYIKYIGFGFIAYPTLLVI